MAITRKAIVSLFMKRVMSIDEIAYIYRLPVTYVEDAIRNAAKR